MSNAGPAYPPSQPPYDRPPGSGPTGASEGSAEKKRSVSTGQLLGGLLFVLVIVFIVENSRKVKVRLIIPEVTAPLYVTILIAAVLGGLITALLRYRRRRHHPSQR
jgi:uncharacterized integral membrane protein